MKKIEPTYKTHLENPEDKKIPLCRAFKHFKMPRKMTTNILEVTCEKCKECLEVKERKKIVEYYDEHFKKHEKAEMTSREYFLIRQEINNQYKH